MNDLKIFENPEFGKIRTLEVEGEPWFVGKDVADILGYSNNRDALDRHVDVEDKNTVVNPDGNRGNPNMTIVNESGLYSLILSSRLPTAKKFKRWVTAEVIPSIRKTGGYQLAPAMDQQHKQLDALQKIRFILDVQAKKMKEDQQAASYWRRAYRDKLEAVKIYKQNISLWRKIFRKVLDGDMDCLDRLGTELPAWYDQAKAISTARYPTFEECMDILTAPVEEDEDAPSRP